MNKVRISYAVSLAEVPKEIDSLITKFHLKTGELASVMHAVSFSTDLQASTQSLRAAMVKLDAMQTILLDCEILAEGLIDIEDKLATQTRQETATGEPHMDTQQEVGSD